MRAKHVVPAYDKVCAEISFVAVEKAGSRSNIAADSGLSAGVEALQLQVGGHEEVYELGVSSRASTTCIDVRSNIVNLLAVLFDDDGTSSGSGIGCDDDSISELDAYDGGACFFVGD